mgnify:CR=1 FL=1
MSYLINHIDPLFVLCGILVGAIVGFTGVGGGSLMTPILILVFGINPSTAATKVYGEPIREGQSPFAIAIGNRFDSVVTENGAAVLLELQDRSAVKRPVS